MRLFLAIELPDTLRAAVAAKQAELKEVLAECKYRWTPPDTFHITLAFLGEVSEDNLSQVKLLALEVCERVTPFSMAVAGLSAFPTPEHPRILYAWLTADTYHRPVDQLGAQLQAALVGLGNSVPDKHFSAHITLARSNRSLDPDLRAFVCSVIHSDPRIELGRIQAENVTLFESHTGDGIPRHIPLAHFSLNGSPRSEVA